MKRRAARNDAKRVLRVCLCGFALTACDSEGTIVPTSDASAATDARVAPSTLVEQGRAFVESRACGTCHETPGMAGVLAGGDAPRPGTKAYATNLTPDPDTGIDGWTDAQYARALKSGVDDQGASLCPPMPRYADMGDDEVKAITAYLRSLAPVHHFVPDSTCAENEPKPDAGDASSDAPSDATDGGTDAPADAPSDAAAG